MSENMNKINEENLESEEPSNYTINIDGDDAATEE